MDICFHPAKTIEKLASQVVDELGFVGFDFSVRPAEPKFGDFQINGALSYAKSVKKNPREVGLQVLEELKKKLDESLFNLDFAGAGFINFTLTKKYLKLWMLKFKDAQSLKDASENFYKGKKVVIDFPSPNTAKQMHVGHLRPMVIGEAIQRLLRFCGANLICDNHIGDWGTNFGILIFGIKSENYNLSESNENALEELESMYKRGSALVKESESSANKAREELLKLQNGDIENTRLWNKINKISTVAFEKMYNLMGITIDVTLGESFYRDKVDRIYKELIDSGIAEESLGALVVFLKDHPRFKDQPFIIRKSDGASNYASTDLATLLYRVEFFNAKEIIYVTDGRQQDHFQQLFLTADKWFKSCGYTLPELKHVWFGTILGEDGKAIKTKSGEPIKLKTLIDESILRAKQIVLQKNEKISETEALNIAKVVGISALRYADLSQNRTNDYVFSWDKLLAFDGNTAPYLMYAVARIHSIFRKAEVSEDADFSNCADLDTDQEIALARKLLALPNVFELTLSELRPHYLCTYLYELAGAFSTFYNANKVLGEIEPVTQKRLLLCNRTMKIMETCLRLLGIETLQKM